MGLFPPFLAPFEAKLQEVDRTANEAAENKEDYDDLGRCQAVEVLKRRCGWQVGWLDGLVGGLLALGILAHRTSEDDWGVQAPPKSKVFRLHYHSQKVIGSRLEDGLPGRMDTWWQ